MRPKGRPRKATEQWKRLPPPIFSSYRLGLYFLSLSLNLVRAKGSIQSGVAPSGPTDATLLHHFISHPAKDEGIGLVDFQYRVTMQVFVCDHCTMIAASVQCHVYEIAKWSYCVRVPIVMVRTSNIFVQKALIRQLPRLAPCRNQNRLPFLPLIIYRPSMRMAGSGPVVAPSSLRRSWKGFRS